MKQVKMKKVVIGALMMVSIGGMAMAQTSATPPPPPPKTWADSITLKGDLRYRYETIGDDSKLDSSKQTYTRQRDRIRARLGAEAKCNDKLKAAIGFTTSEGSPTADPISGNQTLTGGESKKPFWLDFAYVDYSFFNDDSTEVHAIAGKMKNPFITMQDDLVWDGDLTPEGIALKGQAGSDAFTFFGNGEYMWVQERSDKSDLMMYAAQAAVKMQIVEEVSLTLGGSYYGFQSIQGSDCVDYVTPAGAYGNSTMNGSVSGTTTNKAWKSEYTPIVYFAQFDFWVGGLPLAVFVQELNNGDADTLNQGHMYGASIGKAKNPDTWELGYSYAELEKDATLGMFTDSDRWGGGTDGKGSKIYGKYQIMKNLQGSVTYFIDDKVISDATKTKDYNRLQLDLVANF